MNKKFTLLAAALMTASTFTANAEGTVDADTSVKAEEWTVGNYSLIPQHYNLTLFISS